MITARVPSARIEQLVTVEPVVAFIDQETVPHAADFEGGLSFTDEDGLVVATTARSAAGLEIRIPSLGSVVLGAESDTPLLRKHVPDRARILDAYRRFALPLMLQALGLELIHGSGTVVGGRVVSFSGRSGSGKSTTAHALQAKGFRAWADDLVALDLQRMPPDSIRLPFHFRLRGPLGRQTCKVEDAVEERSQSHERRPLAAIFHLDPQLRLQGSSPTLDRLTPKDAFVEVQPSWPHWLPGWLGGSRAWRQTRLRCHLRSAAEAVRAAYVEAGFADDHIHFVSRRSFANRRPPCQRARSAGTRICITPSIPWTAGL